MPGQFWASNLNLFHPFNTFRLQQNPQFCNKSYQKVVLLLNVKRLLQHIGTEPSLSKRKGKKKGQMHVGFSCKSRLAAWHSWKTHCNKPSPNREDTLLINTFSTLSFTARRVWQKSFTTFSPSQLYWTPAVHFLKDRATFTHFSVFNKRFIHIFSLYLYIFKYAIHTF